MKISTLIDTNVLIDVWGPTGPLTEWSASAIVSCRSDGALVVNTIVWSELAPLIPTETALRRAVDMLEWIANLYLGTRHSLRASRIPAIAGPAAFGNASCLISLLVLMRLLPDIVF